MKKTTLLIAILIAAGLTSGQAQNTWVQKADVGGGARSKAVGFSIGSKGYIGTGTGSGITGKDFWEYDPVNNAWTQKSDFGGDARYDAVGFGIGSKGYLGTGANYENTKVKDFWEYDPVVNTWTQKADFGGLARKDAVGFGIGGKGYIGTGENGRYSDFWEYNPLTNGWTQKADFAGGGRWLAVGFSIGGKGYIGTGLDVVNGRTQDFWEYDPSTDTWTQKSDFGGGGRYNAIGFNVGNKGYLGTGWSDQGTLQKDFWEYDPGANTWTQKANFGGEEREEAVGFSIGGKGYVGTGNGEFVNLYLQDFWEYTPDGTTSTCAIPTSLSTSNITGTAADLQWDPVSGAIEYEVGYKVVGAAQFTIVHAPGSNTTLSGLTPLTQYVWRVRTVCSLSPPLKSAYSALVQFTTTNGCDIPTGLFSEPRATSAFLAWDTVEEAISYEIMYRTVGSPFWATVRARGSFITLRGLTPRTTYYWKVKTICSNSPPISSEYSAQESFFTFPR